LFLDAVVNIDLIITTRYGRGFHVDFLEVAQTFQACLGLVDQVGRSPAAFHLAHFAAQHFIFGLGIATEVDAVDIGALARIDGKSDGDTVVLVVGLRDTVDVGKGITLVAQTASHQLGGRRHQLAREHLALLNQQQGFDFFLRHLEIAGQLDFADRVLLTLVDVDGDVDMLLVRRDGHLGRGDVHVDIAAVQIVGAQPLQITGQLLAGILVVVLEERQPVAGLQLEQVDQLLVSEYRVTHHVDVLDGRHAAFVDSDLQGHTVARLGNHFCLDLRRITALGHILALQLVAHALQRGTLEDLTLGQPGLIQALEQVFGGNRLVALDLDAGNGRPLNYADDQDVAVATQLDILEEAGFEQRAGGLYQTLVADLITDAQRQGAEHAARRDTLQAIDANIVDGEGLGLNCGDHERGHSRGEQEAFHEVLLFHLIIKNRPSATADPKNQRCVTSGPDH